MSGCWILSANKSPDDVECWCGSTVPWVLLQICLFFFHNRPSNMLKLLVATNSVDQWQCITFLYWAKSSVCLKLTILSFSVILVVITAATWMITLIQILKIHSNNFLHKSKVANVICCHNFSFPLSTWNLIRKMFPLFFYLDMSIFWFVQKMQLKYAYTPQSQWTFHEFCDFMNNVSWPHSRLQPQGCELLL